MSSMLTNLFHLHGLLLNKRIYCIVLRLTLYKRDLETGLLSLTKKRLNSTIDPGSFPLISYSTLAVYLHSFAVHTAVLLYIFLQGTFLHGTPVVGSYSTGSPIKMLERISKRMLASSDARRGKLFSKH